MGLPDVLDVQRGKGGSRTQVDGVQGDQGVPEFPRVHGIPGED